MSDRPDHKDKFMWEEGDVTISEPPQCSRCQHYNDDATCMAFPGLIPVEILVGHHDHRKPWPGDNGIRFSPRTHET